MLAANFSLLRAVPSIVYGKTTVIKTGNFPFQATDVVEIHNNMFMEFWRMAGDNFHIAGRYIDGLTRYFQGVCQKTAPKYCYLCARV